MKLEDKIRALLEAKNAEDDQGKEQADRIDGEPAVKIENPMDPNLASSEAGIEPQDEIANAEKQGQLQEGVGADDRWKGDPDIRSQDDQDEDWEDQARQQTSNQKASNKSYGDDHDGFFQTPADLKSDGVYRFGSHSALNNRYGEKGKVAKTKWSNAHSAGSDMFALYRPAHVIHDGGKAYQMNMKTGKIYDTQDVEVPRESHLYSKYSYLLGNKNMSGTTHGVTESISDLLGDEFSTEFKLKAQTIFEAAVKDQVTQIQAKLQEEHNAAVAKLTEEFEEKFVARSKQLEEETSDKIDGYLNFLAEEWKQDNKIALGHSIKAELTESFINGIKTVFEQHYVDLPEEKVDVYAKALEEKTELEAALATTVGNLAKLTEEVNAFKREQIITEAVKDFASLDVARFKTLTEDLAFEDADTFKTKVGIVKQSFFSQKQSAAKEQLTEDLVKTPEIVETGSNVETVVEDTKMSTYLRALSKK